MCVCMCVHACVRVQRVQTPFSIFVYWDQTRDFLKGTVYPRYLSGYTVFPNSIASYHITQASISSSLYEKITYPPYFQLLRWPTTYKFLKSRFNSQVS